MIHINLKYNDEKDVAQFASIPTKEEEILHPEWGSVRVKHVLHCIHDKTKEVSITATLEGWE